MYLTRYQKSIELLPLLKRFERSEGSNFSEARRNARLSLSDIQSGREACVVACMDGLAVGFATRRRYVNTADEYRCKGITELTQSYVLPDFRRMGIGTEMTLWHIQDALRCSEGSLLSCIRDGNRANLNAKRGMGFFLKGGYCVDDQRYLVLQLELQKTNQA